MDFSDLFPLIDGDTPYRRLEGDFLGRETWRGREYLLVDPASLRALAREAFHDLAFFLRPSFLKKLRDLRDDPLSSDNDRFVVEALMKNAAVAAEGILPLCQDTGTATIMGWKGEEVLTGAEDEVFLTRGVGDAYRDNCLRYSQTAARGMFDEANTGTNLPAQIDIAAVPGGEYRFLFVAKGGGSANKTSFFPGTPTLLNPPALEKFIRERVAALGTSACPPYRLAVVVGGLSAEMNLKTLKLATAGLLDRLPGVSGGEGMPGAADRPDGKNHREYVRPFLDREWSRRLLEAARETGLGAQFGGRHLAMDARVIRLPRHAASVPVSIGVSCNADRNILGKISRDGVFLEELERNPPLPEGISPAVAARIDLRQPMDRIRRDLSRLAPGSLVLLSGPMVVARDIAHARLRERLKNDGSLPSYFRDHPVYYAGPAKTPPGLPIGSFGPTTAQRMDSYLPEFMAAGASLVSLAKGNRSPEVAAACRDHGGFYLGTIGGAAALLAAENITSSRIVDYPELEMEAVRMIEVRDFPAFVLVDDKGGDFYASILSRRA